MLSVYLGDATNRPRRLDGLRRRLEFDFNRTDWIYCLNNEVYFSRCTCTKELYSMETKKIYILQKCLWKVFFEFLSII